MRLFSIFLPCPSQSRILSAGDFWVKFIARPTLLQRRLYEKLDIFNDLTFSGYFSISYECPIKCQSDAEWDQPWYVWCLNERPLNVSYNLRIVWAWNFPIFYFNKNLNLKRKLRGLFFCDSGVISFTHKPVFISSHLTWLRNLRLHLSVSNEER